MCGKGNQKLVCSTCKTQFCSNCFFSFHQHTENCNDIQTNLPNDYDAEEEEEEEDADEYEDEHVGDEVDDED